MIHLERVTVTLPERDGAADSGHDTGRATGRGAGRGTGSSADPGRGPGSSVDSTAFNPGRHVLNDVTLHVAEGELCVVVGPTGAGKSTLLGTLCGLVPHFTGGHLAGRVTVAGLDTRTHPPRDLAGVVGWVGQDPLSGFVTDTVEEELAYTMEQLGIRSDVMRKRVEETLDLLGIADLRHRALRTLSGGQQQRVAIGAALVAHPRVLVLDEPTSALDPTAADDVLATVTRLVHDLGVTVVMAEHRLERVVHAADRVVHLPGDGTAVVGPASEVFASSSVAPPIVELGRLAGWSPLPMSVRDARRVAGPLRQRLAGAVPGGRAADDAGVLSLRTIDDRTLATTDRLTVTYGETVAVRDVSLTFAAGEVTAIMGRNGSGKSTLLWAMQGSGPRTSGTAMARTPEGNLVDQRTLDAARRRQLVGLIPQTASDLLYLDTVDAECRQADVDAAREPGSCRALLDRLVDGLDPDAHPRDLSEGQRLALVLAIQLTAQPRVVLLDEPTRGLDYNAKAALRDVLRDLAEQGRTVVVSTHDVEFVAGCADRVVVMAQGEVVADGPTADIVVSSPSFAPQVAKILAPQPWLTPAEVGRALASGASMPTTSPASTAAAATTARAGTTAGAPEVGSTGTGAVQ